MQVKQLKALLQLTKGAKGAFAPFAGRVFAGRKKDLRFLFATNGYCAAHVGNDEIQKLDLEPDSSIVPLSLQTLGDFSAKYDYPLEPADPLPGVTLSAGSALGLFKRKGASDIEICANPKYLSMVAKLYSGFEIIPEINGCDGKLLMFSGMDANCCNSVTAILMGALR